MQIAESGHDSPPLPPSPAETTLNRMTISTIEDSFVINKRNFVARPLPPEYIQRIQTIILMSRVFSYKIQL